tara:strand:+ start:302 stop:1072 length:771 start_codon:yes stop_codon:yes gene_type:complete
MSNLSYTDNFLNSLSRASNSVTGLVQQIKEPSYEEKAKIDTESEKSLLEKQGEVRKDTEGYLLGEKAGFDKMLLNMENMADYEIAALNAVTSMKIQGLKGEQALAQLKHATAEDMKDAQFQSQAALAAVDFSYGSSISNPEENQGEGFFGSLGGLIPGSGTYTRWAMGDEDRTKQSMQEFKVQSDLMKTQGYMMLKEYKANPDSPMVQQYKNLLLDGISTAEKLSENSAYQNFDDQTQYYNREMDTMTNMLDMLEE